MVKLFDLSLSMFGQLLCCHFFIRQFLDRYLSLCGELLGSGANLMKSPNLIQTLLSQLLCRSLPVGKLLDRYLPLSSQLLCAGAGMMKLFNLGLPVLS